MELSDIPVKSLAPRIHHLWADEWFLLTSGVLGGPGFNTMTVGWGGLGVMWGKPVAMVVVRPQRYTREFIERYPDFTLCAFGAAHRQALDILGSRSGRDGDKIGPSGLTPRSSAVVSSPCFAEARLVLECRKIYRDAIDPQGFLDPSIAPHYPLGDYHTVYIGELLAVRGTPEYAAR